jgi:hypothetical protein
MWSGHNGHHLPGCPVPIFYAIQLADFLSKKKSYFTAFSISHETVASTTIYGIQVYLYTVFKNSHDGHTYSRFKDRSSSKVPSCILTIEFRLNTLKEKR